MTTLLLVAFSLLQEDPEVAECRRLLEAADQAKATGHDPLAEELTEKVRARFYAALQDHEAALRSNDVERQAKTRPRLAAMARLVMGDANLDPQDLDHSPVLRFLELYSADEATRRARYRGVRESLRDELQILGIPDGFESLLPTKLKPSENAAVMYAQVFFELEALAAREPDSRNLLDRDPLFSHPSEAQAHLHRYGSIVFRLRHAAHFRGVRFPVDYSQGPNALLTHFSRLVRILKILRGCALAHTTLSNHGSAWEMVLLAFRVASCNLHEPLLVSALVNSVLLGIAMDSVQAVAKYALPSEEIVRRLEGLWRRWDPKGMFARAFQGEACCGVISVENLVLGPVKKAVFAPEMETYFREDLLLLLGFLRKARETLTQDYPEAWRESRNLDPRGEDLLPITALLLPALGRSIRNAIRMEGSLRTARVGFACWRYKSKHETFPARLEDLVPGFLGALPTDPFTGNPLLYRNGKIYSAGANGKDDEGIMESDRDDVAFSLP